LVSFLPIGNSEFKAKVASTGARFIPAVDRSLESIMPDGIPTNARIASFIPHPQLLPHVDVMITNGGFNGVQMALAHGVPLIGAGKSEDKPEICARIDWLGAGIALKTDQPTPEQIRAAVGKIIADRSYQHRAQDLQRIISEYDAPSFSFAVPEVIAATLLEQLTLSHPGISQISLTERGMKALGQIVGLETAVRAIGLEMSGTIFHQHNGKTRVKSRKKPLVTLDRTNLVITLLNELTQKYDNSRLNLHFDRACTVVDFAAKTITFQNIDPIATDLTVDYDLLIGADGARSVVRS
jgi:hypothetical protein